MLIRSSDGGQSWSKPETIIDTPWDDRSPAFLELPNGTILCSFFMYSGASIKEHPELAHRTCVIRSFDKGKTWEQTPRKLPSPFLADATDGPPILLKDRSVLLAVYGTPREGGKEQQAIFRTADNGETWQLLAVVKADHELSETGLAATAGRATRDDLPPRRRYHVVGGRRSYLDSASDLWNADVRAELAVVV